MENILEETKNIMRRYNIKPNKSLGQNFLINSEVVENIVQSSDITKAKKVVCIELDTKMVKILQDRFSEYDNIEIINTDVLKINLNEIIEKNKGEIRKVKVVANLPYYITTPIIMKLIEDRLDIESITVMIQKEVADRLIEIPGGKNTGAITYTVYYYCTSKKIMEVPNTSFIPEPEVTSEIIKMDLRYKPVVDVENPQIMFRIIKSAFMQRRKTLLNALTNANVFINKEQGINTLKELNLKENVRAEELTIQDFSNITKIVFGKLKGKNGTDPQLPF